MLGTHSNNVQLLCNLLQTAVKIEAMHERFDVEDIWDVILEELFEILSRRWQIFIHHQLDHEAKVLVTVEANPGQLVIQNQTRGHSLLCKVQWVDSVMLEIVEIQSTLLQFVDRYFSFAFCLDIPVKIELPCRHRLR